MPGKKEQRAAELASVAMQRLWLESVLNGNMNLQ